jgi:U2 small nuclear ribonucleoprotein A'
MRLTADVALSAPVRVNPVGDRELALRGLKLPAIENLSVLMVRGRRGSGWSAPANAMRGAPPRSGSRTRRHRAPSAAQDSIDCLDLTDNEIAKLENFPVMKRLGWLLLAGNRVARVAPGLGAFLPRLHTLVLTGNRIAGLGEVDALAGLPELTRLSLLGNPVTRRSHYRPYVVWRLPALRELDFAPVTPAERKAAGKFFRSAGSRQTAYAR